ncbi:Hypothetical predicted protein [Scomber scombrus]|uniref:Uncharacterized protein n=1 Tax=Scomber scombrus TaxID=13677 RepID=A0AAV1PG49_SCOSC
MAAGDRRLTLTCTYTTTEAPQQHQYLASTAAHHSITSYGCEISDGCNAHTVAKRDKNTELNTLLEETLTVTCKPLF